MSQTSEESSKLINRQVIDAAIKLSAIALIADWCFMIVKPFFLIVLWGAILAVALHPLHQKLSRSLKNNKKLASIIIAVVGVSLIAAPSINIASSEFDSAHHAYTAIEEGTLTIPKPMKN